ncbi:protein translocase subunit SecD [Szabonella alba]|uniref:Multifunctional fusion protein n=1 Tax=Szabonella alba TaxID=2804194 RepID=A0A8K0Y0H1_9RHOB|nr:protein translocase subunit SecD [Szabonella alba]MBL4916832.1 protein translocase subunit SecD [Szabonella alba]
MRRPFWVLATYALLLIAGIALAIPNFLSESQRAHLPAFLSSNTVSLGLDLQGGAHLLLAVDRAALADHALREAADTARLVLEEAGGDPRQVRISEAAVTLPATDAVSAALRAYATEGLAPTDPPRFTVATEAGRIRLEVSATALDSRATDAAARSLEVIRHRIDQVGVAEPQISRVGGDRILVQLPGVEDPGRLRDLLGSTAQMNFHMVDEGAATARPGYRMLPARDGGQIAVTEREVLSGTHLVSASAAFDPQTGQPVVSFRFDAAGAMEFGRITTDNVGRQFAIVLDDQVLTAPVIQQPIQGGTGQITGRFTAEETGTLAVLLNSGSLPASLEVIEERTVGASLGADSIRAGLVAGLAGLGLVVVIMVGLYGMWGLIASAILGLNVALTLAALGMIGATLTLPGIAGIILCLGIAVDANVLIFSRIREETARGAGAMKALALGYDRAWGTILDANVTTLLAMGLLFMLGAGAIRGFAVTMTLGILISMFTAITLMRIVMEGWARHRRMKVLALPPLIGRVPEPGNLSFLRHGALALAGSAILSTLALAALVWPGPHWGIDFTGGVQMVLGSADPIPLAGLRAAVAGFGDAALQTFGAPTEVLLRLQGDATQATVAALETTIRSVVPDVSFDQIELVGPTISGELAWTGALALSAAVLAMLVYIWLRFEWHFAVSAILVLALDVTKTLGVIALVGWEVNLTTIVALLTLIGYSVNDKVVVFDRVRENLMRVQKAGFAAVVDRSLNQVLARCIFTSGTTLAALIPMALWGGPAVAGFAWPMIAGVVIATASSLFVAGPLLVWMAAHHRPVAMPAA